MDVGYKVNFNVDINSLQAACTRTEAILATHILNDTREFVPARTLRLDHTTTQIGKYIAYVQPYAQYVFNGISARGRPLRYNTAVHAKAGPNWVERSKEANMEKWTAIAKKEIMKNGR